MKRSTHNANFSKKDSVNMRNGSSLVDFLTLFSEVLQVPPPRKFFLLFFGFFSEFNCQT